MLPERPQRTRQAMQARTLFLFCFGQHNYRYRSAIALVFAKRDLITICDYYNTRYSVCHDFLIADLTTHTIVRFLTDLGADAHELRNMTRADITRHILVQLHFLLSTVAISFRRFVLSVFHLTVRVCFSWKMTFIFYCGRKDEGHQVQ